MNEPTDRPAAATSRAVRFTRLKIEAVEKQSRGAVAEAHAIPAQERVFTDARGWREFLTKYDIAEVPEVNFHTHAVAAVFAGAQPSPGHGIRIDKITGDAKARRTTVHVVELLPNPRMGYADVVVYPADIVAFPATHSEVRFSRTKKIRRD